MRWRWTLAGRDEWKKATGVLYFYSSCIVALPNTITTINTIILIMESEALQRLKYTYYLVTLPSLFFFCLLIALRTINNPMGRFRLIINYSQLPLSFVSTLLASSFVFHIHTRINWKADKQTNKVTSTKLLVDHISIFCVFIVLMRS